MQHIDTFIIFMKCEFLTPWFGRAWHEDDSAPFHSENILLRTLGQKVLAFSRLSESSEGLCPAMLQGDFSSLS
jgi:hypothetical protein